MSARVGRLVREGFHEAAARRLAPLHECFTFTTDDDRTIVYDVTEAKGAVARGEIIAANVALDAAALQAIVARNAIDAAIVDRADPSVPGIGAAIVHPELGIIYILIDGTHRAARALRDGVPFVANLLTDAATRRCFLGGDPSLLPPAS